MTGSTPTGNKVWLAGGGVKGGVTLGRTDELGYYPVEDPLHVRDFHATLLHLPSGPDRLQTRFVSSLGSDCFDNLDIDRG